MMTNRKAALRATLPATLLLVVLGCSDSGSGGTGPDRYSPPPVLTSVSVTPATLEIVGIGDTARLRATARDQNGNAMSGVNFAWSSSDTSVATVASTGLATSVDRGSATITVSASGKSAEAAVTVSQTPELAFVPDTGYRVDHASIPRAGAGEDGTVYLVYSDHNRNRMVMAASVAGSDGLRFGDGAPIDPMNRANDPLRVRLPGGRWRVYTPSGPVEGFWTSIGSTSSDNGITFLGDGGSRYDPAPADSGRMGVIDVFVNASSEVVLLYIGDPYGANNVRRAISTDDGWTFTFDSANPLGDLAAGGGNKSYVDPFSIALPDGRHRLLTMKNNVIYSFITRDGGHTFTREPGSVLRPSDFSFDGHTAMTLNDPTIVRLPDGRYRIYVASHLQAAGGAREWKIVSATTRSR